MIQNADKFAVNTYSYTLSMTAETCLCRLGDRGFRQFELMMYPGHIWPDHMDSGQRRGFRRVVEAKGLEILTANMPNIDMNLAAGVAEMRAYTLRNLSVIFELASDLGIAGIIVGPGKPNPLLPMTSNHMMGHFFAGLDKLSPLAAKLGVQILIENMPFAFLPDANSLMQALDAYGDPNIGVVYDVANGVFIREDPCDGIRRTHDRLCHIHASDTPLEVYRHDPVGNGVVPFDEIGKCLIDIEYINAPILEIISAEADQGIETSVTALSGIGWDRIAK